MWGLAAKIVGNFFDHLSNCQGQLCRKVTEGVKSLKVVQAILLCNG